MEVKVHAWLLLVVRNWPVGSIRVNLGSLFFITLILLSWDMTVLSRPMFLSSLWVMQKYKQITFKLSNWFAITAFSCKTKSPIFKTLWVLFLSFHKHYFIFFLFPFSLLFVWMFILVWCLSLSNLHIWHFIFTSLGDIIF